MEAALLVASAGTVAILTDGLIATISRFVLICLVVTCVATGTIRLKRRILPRDGLRIGLMAVRARQVAAMIQRLVSQRCVTELVR